MNITIVNSDKNYDNAAKELKKQSPNEKTVVRELKKAYRKELTNALLSGALVGFALVGVYTLVQNVREMTSDNE